MSYTTATEIGPKQHEWLSALDFYEKDLSILDKMLLEAAGKNTGADASAGVEHFQNQLLIQRQRVHDLKHQLLALHHAAAVDAVKHAGHISDGLVVENASIGEDVIELERRIGELRGELHLFLSKWM